MSGDFNLDKILKKERIDKVLVRRGMAESREGAQALIAGGGVEVKGQKVLKSATQIRADEAVLLRGEKIPYVGRGGLKLESALKEFGIDPTGQRVLDVGASTGGFTDCLLQRGAEKVYAVDVGYGQLAWRLRRDPRVVCLERTNIRYLDPDSLGGPVDLVTADVSFISLKKVLPKIKEVLKEGGIVLALVKPQFEVGKGLVGRGGVVKEEARRGEVIREMISYAQTLGFVSLGYRDSRVPGKKKGNVEFFLHLRKDLNRLGS